ncbi:FadR/GntR family transcriptional regulator [Alicyclobacillus sp.]|uniref:FadR/GntR family transcriptional regulator n=1 Tax=Alicyclobacillus sp. TaxID=61169 RepID=UPI0025B9F93D|nr:FadR/GntR family transcriptional regulator [Alicyclobacillus sp.]MCL6517470.1 FadR family transcriptional regulator [Alicyclobacillus sp.]
MPQDNIRPVGRTTLTQAIVNEITDLMMKGVWRPGSALPSEKELAASFGVGRSTIREALQSLVTIGVLETRAGGGAWVREPNSQLLSGAFRWGLLLSPHNLQDLTEVRTSVESECARLAAERRDEADIRRIEESLECMRRHRADDPSFMEWDNRFHQHIAQATKNEIFINLAGTIQSIVRLWYPRAYRNPETKERAIEEHEAILAAIRSGDPSSSIMAMRFHVIEAANRLNRVLREHTETGKEP